MKILIIALTLFFFHNSYAARRFIVSEKDKNIICIVMCSDGNNYSFNISLSQFGGSTQDICNVQGNKFCDGVERVSSGNPQQVKSPPKN